MNNVLTRLFMLLALSCGPAMAAPNSDYQAGVAAFQRADYAGAIAHFKHAEASGLKTPAVYYNLGSAYYKLGNWAAATQAYQKLLSEPKWTALAQYNLGLIAERQGDRQLALQRYREAYSNTQSQKLRRLIEQKLEPIPLAATAAPKRWVGLVGVAAGYDNNAVLSPDSELGGLDKEGDSFAEILGAASRYVSGDANNGWRFDVGGYSRLYADLDDFNFNGVSAGLIKRVQWSVWQTEIGVISDVYYAGSELFTTSAGISARAARDLGKWRFLLSNTAKAIEGGDEFDFLTGWQNRSDIRFSRRFDNASQLQIGMRIELNDRDDFSTNGEFQSYSPERQSLYLKQTQYFGDNWELASTIEYRNTQYSDDDREFNNNGLLVSDSRKEDQVMLSALLRRAISTSSNVYAEANYTDNSGSLDRYEYDREQFALGYEYLF